MSEANEQTKEDNLDSQLERLNITVSDIIGRISLNARRLDRAPSELSQSSIPSSTSEDDNHTNIYPSYEESCIDPYYEEIEDKISWMHIQSDRSCMEVEDYRSCILRSDNNKSLTLSSNEVLSILRAFTQLLSGISRTEEIKMGEFNFSVSLDPKESTNESRQPTNEEISKLADSFEHRSFDLLQSYSFNNYSSKIYQKLEEAQTSIRNELDLLHIDSNQSEFIDIDQSKQHRKQDKSSLYLFKNSESETSYSNLMQLKNETLYVIKQYQHTRKSIHKSRKNLSFVINNSELLTLEKKREELEQQALELRILKEKVNAKRGSLAIQMQEVKEEQHKLQKERQKFNKTKARLETIYQILSESLSNK